MINPMVYTVTVIDLNTDKILGIRRTPVIYTQFKYAEHSVLNVVLSVSLATTVFHFTFVRNINFLGLFQKVIKKGS